MKKRAFTLSEVMITIALIGVIASLTIANVGSSIQKKSRLAQFKAAYSMLETALQNASSDSGYAYACWLYVSAGDKDKYGAEISSNSAAATNIGTAKDSQCNELKEKFLSNLGVTRSCETDSVQEGCITDKYVYPSNTLYPGTYCSPAYSTPFKDNKAYVLDNSMILIESGKYGIRSFAIDVNGRKGPNRWGQDLFTFNISAYKAAKIGNNYYVTETTILPPNTGYCLPGASTDGSTKNTAQMWKEMVGVKD